MYQFAIIGCGDSAQLHATQIQKHGRLVAVCDIVPSKADEIAMQYGARAWYNADQLLREEKDIDIVVVCTPNGYHAEHCIKSLQAGKHVISESPLCLTKAAAWQMIETEKFCRRKLFVVNAITANIELAGLKKVIDEHTADHFYSFDLKCTIDARLDPDKEWQFSLFPGGGSLYTHFTNYIDAVVFLFGEIEEVKGFTDNLSHKDIIEFEDSGEIALKMANGIPGNISWSLNDNEREEAALQILTLKDPLSIGGVEKMISSETVRYEELYEWIMQHIDSTHQSNLYQATKTVEAIEKIYKAVSSNVHIH
ncbi:MAG: Gfo/Idh/MocA family protein [Flavisolibacter sp.]